MDIKPAVFKQNNSRPESRSKPPPVMKLLTEMTISHWISFKEELPVFDSWGPHRKGRGGASLRGLVPHDRKKPAQKLGHNCL